MEKVTRLRPWWRPWRTLVITTRRAADGEAGWWTTHAAWPDGRTVGTWSSDDRLGARSNHLRTVIALSVGKWLCLAGAAMIAPVSLLFEPWALLMLVVLAFKRVTRWWVLLGGAAVLGAVVSCLWAWMLWPQRGPWLPWVAGLAFTATTLAFHWPKLRRTARAFEAAKRQEDGCAECAAERAAAAGDVNGGGGPAGRLPG